MNIQSCSTHLSKGPVVSSHPSRSALPIVPEFFKNLKFQSGGTISSSAFELVASGKSKLVYANCQTPSETPSSESASKIQDVVYIISKNRFVNNELKDELCIGPKIRRDVYLANLEKALESVNRSNTPAKTLAEKLSRQFPTLELLIDALYLEDRRIKEFFLEHSLDPLNWAHPAARRLVDSHQQLALDFALSPSIVIAGQVAVLSKKAEGDLENAVRKKQYRFPQTLSLIFQLIKGFRDLHGGGYIHGDPKLENVLVHQVKGKPILKIGDWGKCKKLSENEVAFHTGNHRYMPPERLSSQKGEVFSVAMMAVRILEEEFLPGSSDAMLKDPEQIDERKRKFLIRTASEKKARRGIERFLSICKGCPEIDANWGDAVRHLAGSLQAFFLKSHKNIDRHIECYLDSLHGQLAAAYGNTQAKKEGIDQLIGQLKEMMQSDRSLRPSMEEALLKLEKTLKCFKQ